MNAKTGVNVLCLLWKILERLTAVAPWLAVIGLVAFIGTALVIAKKRR